MERLSIILAAAALGLAVGPLPGRAADAPAAPAKAEQLVVNGFTLDLPLGLQAGAAYVPDGNPLTADKVALGKLLYFDNRFSRDRTLSCASCHVPYHGFADPAKTSKGVGGQLGPRNSPTVINRLFSKEQFWDGRAEDLELQAHGPLTNPIEMAMGSHDEVVQRVQAISGYGPLFEKAFGDKNVTIMRLAQAIASYERTVVSGNSPVDRYQAGDKDALSASAVRGMTLFDGKANCRVCHAGFNFTDESFHNLGVGMNRQQPDLGRFEVTKNETDKGAFKTPTLRNIVQTAPYMHDGSEATLRQTIEFYTKGGTPNPWLSKEIKPLSLTPGEVTDLVAFLEALTGDVKDLEPPTNFPQ